VQAFSAREITRRNAGEIGGVENREDRVRALYAKGDARNDLCSPTGGVLVDLGKAAAHVDQVAAMQPARASGKLRHRIVAPREGVGVVRNGNVTRHVGRVPAPLRKQV